MKKKREKGTLIYSKKDLNTKKIFADNQGKYIAIEVTYQKERISVLNIYAPNGSKESFFQDIQNHINRLTYENIVVMGDFNGTINNEIDRSKLRKKKKTKQGRLPNSFF